MESRFVRTERWVIANQPQNVVGLEDALFLMPITFQFCTHFEERKSNENFFFRQNAALPHVFSSYLVIIISFESISRLFTCRMQMTHVHYTLLIFVLILFWMNVWKVVIGSDMNDFHQPPIHFFPCRNLRPRKVPYEAPNIWLKKGA